MPLAIKRLLKIFAVISALLLLAIAIFVVSAWAPDKLVADLQAKWAPAPSQFIQLNNMSVHLRDEGPRDDPQPIVLLHGTSSSLHTWQGWSDELIQQRRVIRFDLPGFGLTGPSPDNIYSIESYVQFVIQVLDQLQVERFVVAGNSFGGYIAWMTAWQHPDRVEKLILVDAAGYPSIAQDVPLGFKIAFIPVLNQLARNILPKSLIENGLRNVYGDPDKVTPELVERYFAMTVRAGNREALVERFKQASSTEYALYVSELSLPTLIIWGGRDRLIPPDNAQRFYQDIEGSQLKVFEELGHVPHEEAPQTTVAAVKPFIQDQ